MNSWHLGWSLKEVSSEQSGEIDQALVTGILCIGVAEKFYLQLLEYEHC